jgi:uncharacterized protein YdaU (DUF1376 family)
MSKIRYIKFSPDEYIAGVGAVLDAEQQGVYWMICSMIYSNGGDIPNDPKHIGRLVCLGSSKARRIINHLISIGKITENQSFLSQKRVVTELKTARNRTETAVKHGNLPKKNKHLTEADALFTEKLTTNHKPITNNQDKDFDLFWEVVAVKKGKGSARKAFNQALKKTTIEDLITKMSEYKGSLNGTPERFIKHPASWLNGECWTDEGVADDFEQHLAGVVR